MTRSDKPSAQTMKRALPSGSACRVMIVDDFADAAESLRLLLELEGHEVRTLNTDEDVIAQVRTFRPRVMVLDVGRGMRKAGLELARQMRAAPDLKDIALLAWSGYGRPQDVAAGLAAGFDHYLIKPTDPDVLVPIVDEECKV